jgi:hypothetical protein
MISNVYDLGKWAKAVGTGELITDNMKIDCFDFVPADEKSPMSYGLGVFGLFGSLRGHTGVIQGFQSCFLYSPVLDVSIVAWVNKCNETQPDQPATHMVVNSFHTLYHELF